MYDSPVSLQDICIDYISSNLPSMCEPSPAPSTSSPTPVFPPLPPHDDEWPAMSNAAAAGGSGGGGGGGATNNKCVFREEDVFMHAEISEQLLTTIGEKRKLNDFTLTLFDAANTRLRHVRLRNAGALTTRGLRTLRGHKVYDLEVTGLKVTVNDLVGCLGEWTVQNLRSLNVSRSTFLDGSKYCVVVALSKFKALSSLNVSWTEFNTHSLEQVADDLPRLECLDISCTRVDDIRCLRKWRATLKTLRMYNLKVSKCDSVLLDLDQLRTLDISDEPDPHLFEIFNPVHTKVTRLLRAVDKAPHLTHLDISGKEEINSTELNLFIKHHPRLQFLGLIHSEICYDDTLINAKNPDYNPDLVIAGTATEAQILQGLRRYADRPLYVQKCLYNLFRLTPTFNEARVDVINLVLPGMRLHPQQFGVQMAATACLYNLTKCDLAAKIHPRVLKQVVELTLTAMETFPNHYQLQKNTLLTLCSDRILQEVAFNKYHCATLVMNCLCSFEDASMNRMSVAICSILAAKISTNETSQLGAHPQYMRKLLDIVQAKVQAKQVDITVKFTLSALWNLTDESPKTCKVFLEEGGMPLFLVVLATFEGESTVETKVLGLINNIAEVGELRGRLMVEEFLVILRRLLLSCCIDVSYFAAGIIAHLASDRVDTWTVSHVSRDDLLEQLGLVVSRWETPDGEMVAYRSFRPFFPLLTCRDAHPVQLWAVWAIQHVCTKNAKRYCPMLAEEGGSAILRNLWRDPAAEPTVRHICRQILDALDVA